MRPTSLRELPDLPGSNHKRNPSGAGVVDKPMAQRTGQQAGGGEGGDGNSYDHLGTKINSTSKGANYDHITIEPPRGDPGAGTTPVSESETASDGHYAQVRERTYDVVQDVRARSSAKAPVSEFDPYSKVRDDDDKEDPYAKVKDTDKDDGDDDYAHLKHDHAGSPLGTSNHAGGAGVDDEDPYERVLGDSASGQVQSSATRVDPDDPYAVVGDQPSVTVVPIRSSGTSVRAGGEAANAQPGASNKTSEGDNFHLQFADEEGQDDYAVVVKDRHGSASRDEESGSRERDAGEEEEIEPYFSTPPEPPRMYGASEVGGFPGAVGGAEASDNTTGSGQRSGEFCLL
nr:hypothetical protein BaRGS_026953 [Batillaria attramentaria]